jgi:hypothetical protein
LIEGRFVGSTSTVTNEMFAPSSNKVARTLGLPVHDIAVRAGFDEC